MSSHPKYQRTVELVTREAFYMLLGNPNFITIDRYPDGEPVLDWELGRIGKRPIGIKPEEPQVRPTRPWPNPAPRSLEEAKRDLKSANDAVEEANRQFMYADIRARFWKNVATVAMIAAVLSFILFAMKDCELDSTEPQKAGSAETESYVK